MIPSRLALSALLATAVFLLGPTWSDPEFYLDPSDTLLGGDVLDPISGRIAEIAPGAAWIQPGPDGEVGTPDDQFFFQIGDVDLVIRAGHPAINGSIPPPAALQGAVPHVTVGPFGSGTPVDFVVIPSDGAAPAPYGSPATAPYLQGLPVLALAFADLDGDGYVGITHLDGDPNDASLEEAELRPVGRRYALMAGNSAAGELAFNAGGPASSPLRIALAAVAFAGSMDPSYFDGVVPNGPAIMTRLPFFPVTTPWQALKPFSLAYLPAVSQGRVAVQARVAMKPDPSDPRVSESYTLRLDGTDPTIDVVHTVSGAPVRFGFVQRPDPTSYLPLATRPIRPCAVPGVGTVAVEVLSRLVVPDDGPASTTTVRVVALDQLGNLTTPNQPTEVKIKTRQVIRILSPDLDGNPYKETLTVVDAQGVELILDDSGGAFDDPNFDRLIAKGSERLMRLDVSLPDPDLDDDGAVTLLDQLPLDAHLGTEAGDPLFEPDYDLDGSGRIDAADFAVVLSHLGESAVPDGEKTARKKKGGRKGKRGPKPGK